MKTESWHIDIIAQDDDAKAQFISKYPDLLITEKLTRTDHGGRYRRRLAQTWARSTNRNYKFVQSAFSRLGYATLSSLPAWCMARKRNANCFFNEFAVIIHDFFSFQIL
ncbi:hypothetical protein MASR1M12_02510 [Erysipelotrichia bacterium]